MTGLTVVCAGGSRHHPDPHERKVVETFRAEYSVEDGHFMFARPVHRSSIGYILDGDIEVRPDGDLESDERAAEAMAARGGQIQGRSTDHLRYRLVCQECGDSLTLVDRSLRQIVDRLLANDKPEVSLRDLRIAAGWI